MPTPVSTCEAAALEYELRAVGYDSPDAVLLTAEVQAEYARRYGDEGDTAPIDTSEFAWPRGRFVMAYVDGVVAAMGGWRRGGPAGDSDAEIKRMYVSPQFQRMGLARAVLADLEHSAREAGVNRLVLETGLVQPEAVALYRSAGYDNIPAFGHYAGEPLSIHLAKL